MYLTFSSPDIGGRNPFIGFCVSFFLSCSSEHECALKVEVSVFLFCVHSHGFVFRSALNVLGLFIQAKYYYAFSS